MLPREEFIVTGAVPAGTFAFAPVARSADGTRLRPEPFYQFDSVRAQDAGFDVDEVRVHISGSEFDRCVFRQDPRITRENRRQFAYSNSCALLGFRERSVYRDCVFDHVDFGLRGGGFCPCDVRFERCTFRYCTFRDFDCREADFVGCTFTGVMTKAWFHGVSGPSNAGRRVNVFDGNDFTRARLRRVEFRGVDLRTSRLPDGPEYLRVDDFRAKARQARAAIVSWPEAERRTAERLLGSYEKRWSEPLFGWRRALAHPESRLWPLLESF